MGFKFASSRIDVLPENKIPLSGLRIREPESVHLGIKECNLKIAWLSFSEEEQFIFFLADYLFFPDSLADQLAKYLFDQYKIDRDHIVFGATHTHSGPALGFLPWEEEQPEYLTQTFKKIVSRLDALKQQLGIGQISQGSVDVEKININRRLPVPYWRWGFRKKALMLPNPKGPLSTAVKVIQFASEAGKKIWFISHASHPVFNRNLSYSSDYPGSLAEEIRSKGWADEVFVFPGFAGDVRPNYQGRTHTKARLRQLVYGPDFADYLPQHFEDFVSTILGRLQHINFSNPQKLSTPEIRNEAINLPSESGKTQKKLSLKKLTFGSGLNLLIANAEMFVQYELSLPKDVFTISCTDRCIGYVPTAQEVKYGGYEVEDAAYNNAMDAAFASEGLNLVEKILSNYFK